jgi:hypothetical protein
LWWCRVDEEDFAKTLLADPETIIELTSLVDIRKATAFNPDDIELIFGMIREMPGDGFVTINATMKGQVSGVVVVVAVCSGRACGVSGNCGGDRHPHRDETFSPRPMPGGCEFRLWLCVVWMMGVCWFVGVVAGVGGGQGGGALGDAPRPGDAGGGRGGAGVRAADGR